jgi:alpha-3'-ketoglucosidase
MLMRKILPLMLLFACSASVLAESARNVLTEKEKESGWQLLFDGRTTKGWMTINSEHLPEKYVQDGCLNPHPCDYMLVYEKPLENYVLSLDFKITAHCNSGIFVRTMPLTRVNGRDVGYNGIEIAIDDTKTAGYVDTGAFYDLAKPKKNAMKAIGEWNHIVITSDHSKMSVVLNGEAVSQIDLDEFREPNKRPDGTPHKFDVAYKDHPRKGYIGLQDHGSDCWFRDIKLKRLP